jgi:hypothetical protein
MRVLFCAFLCATSLLHAEENDPRKRMVFPPNRLEPEPTPTTVLASQKSKPEDPGVVISMFFLGLKAGQVDAAYDALIRNTIIAERKENVSALKESTNKALDSYGPVTGYEVIDSLQVGSSLVRQTCLSLNQDLPLRWRFYFYRSEGIWKLVDMRVDDGLVELFEEAGRRAPSKSE